MSTDRLVRRATVALTLLGAFSRPAVAHPGVGIVMDARGAVFYTDLTHVWRIAPNGARSIVVRNVHTHELCLDAEGNLYGEHLWYEGEATDKWGHYVWRLRPNGVLDTVIGPKEGFLTDYSFVRDRDGVMYWADRERNEIRKRPPGGAITVLARHPFRDVRWMTATPSGVVYLTDDGDLLRVDRDGRVSVVAKDLREKKLTQVTVPERQTLMGLWTDPADNVYLAVWGGRMVKRVAPNGAMSVVARSALGWGPTGGLVAPNGDLWVLETSLTNAARVQRHARDGTHRTW